MSSSETIVFYHSPNTRSSGTRLLLEELGAPHEMRVVNMKAGEQRKSGFLAVNPMGKVPAILHRGHLVTEQGAIVIYLADLFPKAGLTPGLDDPLRGPYLRWLVYYGSSFEPAVVDRALKREQAPLAMSPYGDFDTMLTTLTDQLSKGPYLLGDRMTAADVLWGTALNWTTAFKIVPEVPAIMDYIKRITSRPAFGKVKEADAKLSAAHDEAAKAMAS
jgi:glutathione S-transferase